MTRKVDSQLPLIISIAGLLVLTLYAVGVGYWAGRYSQSEERGVLISGILILVALFGLVAYCSVWRPMRLWKSAEQNVVRLTSTDPLTNLLNRVAILDELTAELNRSLRTRSPLALAVLSVDDLESVQKQFGVTTRNTVLRAIGNMIGTSRRKYDMAGRYGGNSFLIVLPETDAEGAARALERLRERIESSEFSFDGIGYDVTVSIGVTQADTSKIDTLDSLMNRADRALKLAIEEGGNCVYPIVPGSATA